MRNRKEIKYVLLPGEVRSKFDGQLHYIPAKKLARLYMVDPAECVVVRENEAIPSRYKHLPTLYPRYEGDYPFFDAQGEKR